MSSINFEALKQTLINNPNVQKLVDNLKNLSEELAAKEGEIRGRIDKEKTSAVKQALAKYKEVVKAINDVEKNIAQYKKAVIAQKAKVEKTIFGKTTAKKTTKKVATKKVATTKKATTKKVATTKKASTKKVATKKAAK